MKKYIVLFLSLLSMLVAAAAMAACEHQHSFEFNQTLQAATCTEDGLEEYICRDCGYLETRTSNKLEHLWNPWKKTITATCSEQGEEWRVCRRDPSHVETRTTDFADHDWNKWQVTIPATCLQQGEEVRTCKNDPSHTESRIISFGDHDWNEWQVITQATCSTQGEEVRICKNDPTHIQNRIISFADHDWNEWQVVTQATCSTQGKEVRTCKNDPTHTENHSIKALGHDWDKWQEVTPATCLEAGEKTRTCKNDPSHTESETLEPTGHNWGKWQTVTQATCLESGEDIRTCSHDDSHTESRTTDPVGHTWGAWRVVKPATCIGQGWEFRVCQRTGAHIEHRPIEALGHTDELSDWTVIEESTCTIAGQEARLCLRCDEPLESRRTAVLEHKYLNGVCHNCHKHDWSTAELGDPDLYNSDYAFRALVKEVNGAAMQALYLLIDADARAYHNGNSDALFLGEYDYTELELTTNEAIATWKTYLDDHPLYYWMNKELTYTVEKLSVKIDPLYTNHEVRVSLNQSIYAKANAWREDTVDNAYLTALSYHDKIIYEINYLDSKIVYPEGTSWAHNIVGVFEGRAAVCEGYARSFQLLLNMTGIENIFVTGMSGDTAHAWNLVRLDDGNWYSFDLTFDDSPRWMWGVQYNYFAVSDEQNLAWSDNNGFSSVPRYFSTEHTPDAGTGIKFLVQLPETAKTPYAGAGELLLRQTFTVNKYSYAVAGYRAVQLIQCGATGDVHIPETVNYGGITYDVISIGAMDKRNEGFFTDFSSDVYTAAIKTLYIPASIRFLWTSAIHNEYNGGIVAFEVSEENEAFTSVDGILFTKGMYTLISYPDNSPRTEYKIPDGVKVIASHAFRSNTYLRSYSYLRSLTIGKDVDFAGNPNWGYGWLRSATEGSHNVISDEWGWITGYAGLSGLETLLVDPENRYYTAENNVLYSKDKTCLYATLDSIEELVVPASVVTIECSACYGRSNLKKLVFEGNAIKQIRSGAFSNCFVLKEIIFNGTRAEWDAVNQAGLDYCFRVCNPTVTCTQD